MARRYPDDQCKSTFVHITVRSGSGALAAWVGWASMMEEATSLLGMTKDYLYRHWRKLGGYRDDDSHVKFALSTIERHIQRRAGRG
jgi:hypothetical protein